MFPSIDVRFIERVTAAATAAVLRELGYAKPAEPEPEYMTGPELRSKLLRCSKDTFRVVSRQPDFPAPVDRGSTLLWNVAAVRAWLAAREVRPDPPSPVEPQPAVTAPSGRRRHRIHNPERTEP